MAKPLTLLAKPRPVGPDDQAESLKAGWVQVVPSELLFGA